MRNLALLEQKEELMPGEKPCQDGTVMGMSFWDILSQELDFYPLERYTLKDGFTGSGGGGGPQGK